LSIFLIKSLAMSRSLRVRQDCIPRVKSAVQRNGYPRQKDLAEDVGFSLATVSNFLNGKPVDCLNFLDICKKLGLEEQAIAVFDSDSSNSTTLPEEEVSALAFPDELEAKDFIYVERPPIESLCYETLLQPGALLRIKAPGLMGKTSLMAKVLPQLARQGYRTVSLNLHYAETEDFTNLDKFLKWFCVSVGHSLKMPNQLADYWDEQFSTSKMNCTAYFEEYLLASSDSPLVLCLDEVERIFSYREVASDFLGLLRAWHEQAKIRNIWKRLRLVVIHSTEIYVPLKLNESPFNVGVPIELPEFTPEQVQNLAQQQGLSWGLAEVKQLMEMVGGHPELVQQALSHLKINQSVTLEQILQTAATEAGIYGNHLRRHWCVIQQHLELAEALKKVVKVTTSVRLEPMQAYKLHRMKPAYKRLTFVLLGVATPSDFIQDKNRTPFNIGRAIEVCGFKLDEAQPLAVGLAARSSNPQAVVKEVLGWTGGQPFLTQKLCQFVSTSESSIPVGEEAESVEQLVRSRIIENWEAQDNPEHLRTIRDRLLRNEQRTDNLLRLYRKILGQGEIVADDSSEQMALRLSGLVVKQLSKLKVYNRIYDRVFNQSWIDRALAELRPYSEAITFWLASNCQDESRLLRGQALQEALSWAAGKSLSNDDYHFLTASQELALKEAERELRAMKIAALLQRRQQLQPLQESQIKRRQAELLKVEAQIGELEKKRVYQRRVQEKGLERRSLRERLQENQRLYEKQLAELTHKIEMLQGQHAICPLCERSLDEAHSNWLLQKTTAERQAIQEQFWIVLEQLAVCDRELQVLRNEYVQLSQELAPLESLLKQRGQLEGELELSAAEIDPIKQSLPANNEELILINQELQQLGYTDKS